MSQESIVRILLPCRPGELGVGRGVVAQLGLTQAGRTAAWLVKGCQMLQCHRKRSWGMRKGFLLGSSECAVKDLAFYPTVPGETTSGLIINGAMWSGLSWRCLALVGRDGG